MGVQTKQPSPEAAGTEELGATLAADHADEASQDNERNADDEGRAYVVQYNNTASFPFEIGETVWIMKPGYRAPIGPFVIVKAHSNELYELKAKQTSVAHSELVEKTHLVHG